MYSFNANVAGYMSDVYVQWSTLPGGGWEGSFDYNTGWIKPDDVEKVLKPGRYKLGDESSDYEIEADTVVPKGDGIYRVYFTGVGGMPMERNWDRARDLHSTLSWDEQVMEKIKSGHKTSGDRWVESLEGKQSGDLPWLGCLVWIAFIVGVLWALEYFFDIIPSSP